MRQNHKKKRKIKSLSDVNESMNKRKGKREKKRLFSRIDSTQQLGFTTITLFEDMCDVCVYYHIFKNVD